MQSDQQFVILKSNLEGSNNPQNSNVTLQSLVLFGIKQYMKLRINVMTQFETVIRISNQESWHFVKQRSSNNFLCI